MSDIITLRFDTFDDSKAAFVAVADAIGECEEVGRIYRSHGAEEIEFKNGMRIKFRARTATRRDAKGCNYSCSGVKA